MNKYIVMAGAFALVLSGVPAIVIAQAGESRRDSSAQVTAVTSVRVSNDDSDDDNDASTTMRIKGEDVREVAKQQGEQDREMMKERAEQAREMFRERFELQRESTTTPALSWGQFKQLMKERKQELDDEEASTTPRLKDVMKNANEVRLAVHTLLASKDLFGGIGPQVSEIAKHMNDSVATTTSAEARIESRGFLAKLFFGGDKKASKDISKAVERNQENIAKLTELLSQASTTAELKIVLAEQIAVMQAQITRLQAVAAGQAKLWGLFSWRF